jgi:two-component system invasion response regulator UvrY
MNILIADDHAVVRRGLRDILSEALPGVNFIEARTGDEVISQLAKSPIGLAVLDINMPGRSGLDVLKDIKLSHPRLPVIILSVQPEEQYAVRCLRAGAAAYISKDSAADELGKAVKKILSGGRYISASVADSLLTNLDRSEKPPHELLSDREFEVMRRLASGSSLTSIGNQLHVSVKTISTYRARIMEKMQMGSNAELTRYALRHKLIE